MSNKRVGVVCATYRSPEKNSLVREYGTIALVEQMFKQDYDGEIFLALVDSSPTPHPFFEQIEEKFKDRLVYVHVPSRNGLDAQMQAEFPKASSFIPSDDVLKAAVSQDIEARLSRGASVHPAELKLAQGYFNLTLQEWDEVIGKRAPSLSALSVAFNGAATASVPSNRVEFWQKRVAEMRAFAKFVPFDKDYPIQTNIFSQIFGDRPSIGMKKNVGVQALAERFGNIDTIVFSDDDDHHAPDYVRRSVEALDDGHFTRMTRYITHKFAPSDPQWGVFDLQIEKDENNYWVLPADQEDRDMKCYGPQGPYLLKVGEKFSRPVTMAWPIISHEGRLHTISFNAWEKAVEKFGGAVPVSFCEDIIYYRKLRDALGGDFKDSKTIVQPGQESFLCISDGANASVIETMEDIDAAELPEWATQAVDLLYKAASAGPLASHPATLASLGRQFAETGTMDLQKALPGSSPLASAPKSMSPA